MQRENGLPTEGGHGQLAGLRQQLADGDACAVARDQPGLIPGWQLGGQVAGGRGNQQGLLLAVANAGLSGFVPSVAAAMIQVSGLMRRHQLDHALPQP